MQCLCLGMYPDLSRLILLGRLVQEYFGSILLVLIYYNFLFHHLFLFASFDSCRWGGWFQFAAVANSQRKQLQHRVPAVLMAPLVGSLALLITNTPVKWLD